MNNGSSFESKNWYAPLQTGDTASSPAENAAPVPEKAKRPRRGWTPGKVLGVIALVALVIAGSSLLFASSGAQDIMPPAAFLPASEETASPAPAPEDGERAEEPPEETPSPEGPSSQKPDDMPESFFDFFRDYFTTVDTDQADIHLERAALPIDFTPELVGHGKRSMSTGDLYEACSDSVVGIIGYINGNTSFYWGTGVVLSEDGLVLTNTHVIDGCDRATVLLPDDTELEALLVGADTISDLAVLKVEAEGLVPVEFGQSGDLRVGDPVVAIGNPLGIEFRNTLTNGIISAIDRGVSYKGRTMTLLQTNTALNEGNSGGALFNMYGQVIGITNMKMMSSYSSIEGIGFAIPSATVQKVVASLVRDGEVRGRPAIGITVGSIPTEAMERYEIPEGLYVSAVSPGSDAEAKGILPGDIIVAVDGEAVSSTDQVNDLKNKHEVGEDMIFRIWRDGEELEIAVTLMDTNDIYG